MTSDPTGTPRARHAVSPQLSRRTVLAGLAAAPLVGFAAPRARAATFVDVPSGAPFHDDIEWAAAQGITTGWSGPDVPADPADRARGDGRLPLPLRRLAGLHAQPPVELGFDCSGLVLQAIYAAGRDPQPIDVIKHAEPTYRTSAQLYAHTGLQSVPVAQRRRGDLIFYTNSAGRVHHVTIDLGDGTMMEAYGRYAGIRTVIPQYGISYIAPYVKRVFP